ncbi:hypothetical protein NHX12_019965 [Muraenolepis orangiensis]|uniref:EGF-like domain-containing protein n=1 Tax=Muraenolepis orangiensis TaxID=630683 RepID=A0A9Q0IWI6_9TELE|nr:hypothetical protein NHX12_019965 [Muraenolepis orangiensis]
MEGSEGNHKELYTTAIDCPSTTCQEDSCANMGICIQQWENYTCDCSMTSYTGTQCNDREYNPAGGHRRPHINSYTSHTSCICMS